MSAKSAAWVTTVTALVALVATNGKALVEVLHATWLFMLQLADGPGGVGYFALAIGISVGLQLYLRRHYRPTARPASRSFQIDTLGALAALGVMCVLMRSTFGFLLGLQAAFMAPWVSRGIAMGIAFVRRKGCHD